MADTKIFPSPFSAAAAVAISVVVAGSAAAQETWAPSVVFNGVSITRNGATTPLPVPVPVIPPIYPLPQNPPLAYPNGVCENPVTQEWIVADTYHGRLLRFSAATGEYRGALITGNTTAPYGPTVDDDGTIVVANYYDGTVSAFVPSGGDYIEQRFTTFVDGGVVDRFDTPVRVALVRDGSGRVSLQHGIGGLLVLDSVNSRVVRLDATGGLAAAVAGQWHASLVFGEDAAFAGPGPGHFHWPTGLAVDDAGRIYVSDPNNTAAVTIQVFDPAGNLLQTIADGLSSPWALAVDSEGRLFVADSGNNRVAVFDKYDAQNRAASLAPIAARIGSPSQPLGGLALPGGPNPPGPPGELQEPTSIAFDHLGRLMVADTDNFRIQIFDRARLFASALADPQTISASDGGVTVRLTVTAPAGGGGLTNVHPSVPVAAFAAGGGAGTPVVDATPSCVTTPGSTGCLAVPAGGTIADALLPGIALNAGSSATYTFFFPILPGAAGPVWFSANGSAVDGSGAAVVSPAAQTFAVAAGGDRFHAPSIAASLSDPSGAGAASGWYRRQPILVNLFATLPDPGAGLDVATGDGQVQEIQYGVGPAPPVDGAYYSCFSLFAWEWLDPAPPYGTCAVAIFKEGATTVWYRALSTRGLYDHLVPDASSPAISVPGWTPITVHIDVSSPAVYVTGHGPHHDWFSTRPATIPLRAEDTLSQLAGVSATSSSPGFSASIDQGTDVPFLSGTLTFAQEGTSAATVTAIDRAGNGFSVPIDVRIDTTPPAFSPPTAASPTGIVPVGDASWSRTPITVSWTATDAGSGFDEAGAHVAPCATTVDATTAATANCTVEDWAGNAATSAPAGPFGVDATAPALVVPAGVHATAYASNPSAVVNFTGADAVSARDNVDPSPRVSCVPASGSAFHSGDTTVTCTATDAVGNRSTRSFVVTVTVLPNSTPVCDGAYASADLWPPNHRLVPVTIAGVTNADGSPVAIRILGIAQDEPTAGLGQGDTPIDGFGVGTATALVRAERSGGSNGRVYHIRFSATSPSANACTGGVTLGVPHDQSGPPAIDDGAVFDSTKAR